MERKNNHLPDKRKGSVQLFIFNLIIAPVCRCFAAANTVLVAPNRKPIGHTRYRMLRSPAYFSRSVTYAMRSSSDFLAGDSGNSASMSSASFR